MTDLSYDGWAIERRQADGVFEYVAFLDRGREVGIGRWDVARSEWADLPDALSALSPGQAEEIRARASDAMMGGVPGNPAGL